MFTQVLAIMERENGSNGSGEQIEYKAIQAIREGKTKDELRQALVAGFEPEEFVRAGRNWLVLSKTTPTPGAAK